MSQLFYPGCNIARIVLSMTASSTGGFTAEALDSVPEGRIMQLITDPGATAPSDNYDITLLDAAGIDRLQSCGLNRSATASQLVEVVHSTSKRNPVIMKDEVLTFTVANNTEANAVIQAQLFIARGA